MTDRTEINLDTALAELADDVNRNTLRPGADLVARVLADAGSIAAANRPAHEAASPARALPRPGALFFGWRIGAIAAMAMALVAGVSVGMEMDAGDLPMMQAEEEAGFFTADAGFLPEDLL